ncbi:hypothetical protein ACTMTU_07735 [Streptomyces sp. OZ13]|uniref:hypothetical protein n=1 Tax=Streptomyces sp. OZ13 TaxID=3452210 RepID=UPI003F8BF1D4
MKPVRARPSGGTGPPSDARGSLPGGSRVRSRIRIVRRPQPRPPASCPRRFGFKKGADGRTFALVKAGLAGAFTYNRLKAAVQNAKGDPLLSKAVAPLGKGIEKLKNMGTKLRDGTIDEKDVNSFESVITDVKDAGRSAGAPVKDKVPSTSELGG